MIVVMKSGFSEEQIDLVKKHIEKRGLTHQLSEGVEKTVIGVVGLAPQELKEELQRLSGVASVIPISEPYKLSSRSFKPEDTVVKVGDVTIGGNEVVVMAGPCSVESEDQLLETAIGVKKAGARILRGGAFKPRTSPYGFRGLGESGLRLLSKARDETGLPVITEVLDKEDVELVSNYVDILQIGARNVQNFKLLQEVGKRGKAVVLKRGFSTTYEEWLLAAEYILNEGNNQLILCERGIRTFETYTRNTMDIGAIPAIKTLSHLPIIADPSHGTGHWEMVSPMALASVAAGADGLLIEVHRDPSAALSDGFQSLNLDHFASLMNGSQAIAKCVGRNVQTKIS